MKKLIRMMSILILAVLLFTVVSCGGTENPGNTNVFLVGINKNNDKSTIIEL